MKISLAEQQHDPGIRRLLRETPIPGRIEVAYMREPDFFQASKLAGEFSQTIVATEKGVPVGMGARNIRSCYVNGKAMDIGYLSSLRAMGRRQAATGLARAYRFLHELHGDCRAPFYLSTIVDDNQSARALLTSGRSSLPHYIDCGLYETYAVGLSARHRRRVVPSGIEIKRGGDVPLSDIVAFLKKEGSRRQFFPVYETSDFESDVTRAFSVRDFYVALRQGRIVGVVGCWDQRTFKQCVVVGYHGAMKATRPLINVALRARGYRALPAPGEPIKLLYAAFVCVAGDDVAILKSLLEHIHDDNSHGESHFLAVGFHHRDPLRAAVRGFHSVRYRSRLYVVCWEDGEVSCQQLDHNLIPYLELGTL
jgi:hypothetical protein